MTYKISVTDDCTGCELCVGICDNFTMQDEKAAPVNAEVEDVGCNQDAADQCPVSAIKVEEA